MPAQTRKLHLLKLLVGWLSLGSVGSFAGDLVKCTSPDGAISFTDRGCANEAKREVIRPISAPNEGQNVPIATPAPVSITAPSVAPDSPTSTGTQEADRADEFSRAEWKAKCEFEKTKIREEQHDLDMWADSDSSKADKTLLLDQRRNWVKANKCP